MQYNITKTIATSPVPAFFKKSGNFPFISPRSIFVGILWSLLASVGLSSTSFELNCTNISGQAKIQQVSSLIRKVSK